MIKTIRKLTLVSAVAALCACSQQAKQESSLTMEVEKDRIKAHLEFLADDYLEGRDTGSRGYEIAANYVAAEFKKLGLKPAGEEGYIQRVPFRRGYLNQQTTQVTIGTGDSAVALKYPQEYMMSTLMNTTEASVTADAVFVGYGLIADKYDYNDYKDLDVDGKIVVMLSGRPESWPSEEGAHLASRAEKSRYAAE